MRLTLEHVSYVRGVGEDLQEVLRRGFAGLHPRHDAARNLVGWVQSRMVGGEYRFGIYVLLELSKWDHERESKLEGGVMYGGGLYRRSGPAYLIIGLET
jgi:hypothetical protein